MKNQFIIIPQTILSRPLKLLRRRKPMYLLTKNLNKQAPIIPDIRYKPLATYASKSLLPTTTDLDHRKNSM